MYYGICQWNLPVSGPEGCYELVKLGLDGMELGLSDELIENLDEYKSISEETGVKFPTIGMNVFCGMSYITEGSESDFVLEIEKAIKCATVLGIKTIQIPAFFASDISTDSELQIAARNLQKACEMAAPHGIYIGTENALDLDNNLKLFGLVNRSNFKFYFDNQNLWRMKGKSCAKVREVMRENIIEAHAKDSLMVDGIQQWMPLGEGDAEFEDSFMFLKDSGYDGWIHLENEYQLIEPNEDGSENYSRAIARDIEVLKKIFN